MVSNASRERLLRPRGAAAGTGSPLDVPDGPPAVTLAGRSRILSEDEDPLDRASAPVVPKARVQRRNSTGPVGAADAAGAAVATPARLMTMSSVTGCMTLTCDFCASAL